MRTTGFSVRLAQFSSLPADSKILTVSALPLCAATCSRVQSALSFTLEFAPPANRTLTVAVCPPITARCNGASPFLSIKLGFSPLFSNLWTFSVSPLSATLWRLWTRRVGIPQALTGCTFACTGMDVKSFFMFLLIIHTVFFGLVESAETWRVAFSCALLPFASSPVMGYSCYRSLGRPGNWRKPDRNPGRRLARAIWSSELHRGWRLVPATFSCALLPFASFPVMGYSCDQSLGRPGNWRKPDRNPGGWSTDNCRSSNLIEGGVSSR